MYSCILAFLFILRITKRSYQFTPNFHISFEVFLPKFATQPT